MRWIIFGVICGALVVLPAQTVSSVWDGVYTDQQAKRGEPLYREHCADCHGEDLEGDAEAPALSGGTFVTNWNGLPLGSLFQRIRRDMPLNGNVGKLGSAASADILAFMLKANRFPSGTRELSRSGDALDQIRFEATKRDQKR